MSGSCVTSTTVMPSSALRAERSAMISFASRRVKTARRLVCEKQLRARDDGARNRDALLLSARELRRRMVLPVQQAYAVERGPRQLAALGGAHAAVEERKLHVLKRRRSGEKIEALKDEAEVLAPQERTLVARQALDVHSAEEIRARRRAVERADDVHGRRLARARRAHDGDEFRPRQSKSSRRAGPRRPPRPCRSACGCRRVQLVAVPLRLLRRPSAGRRRPCRPRRCRPRRFLVCMPSVRPVTTSTRTGLPSRST